MKLAILVTGHYFNSKRKAGFHWLADSLWRQGWEVIFLTAAISWLSVIRRDYRLAYPVLKEANQLLQIEPGLYSYVWFTPWHPANLRLDFLNDLSGDIFCRYSQLPLGEVEPFVRDADLIFFESTPAILLFEKFKTLNQKAKYIYRVSDDLRLLRNHPLVLETEQEIAPKFDLISVPSQSIYEIFQGLPNLEIHWHGIRKDLFDKDYTNPYLLDKKLNLVFVGNSYFDRNFLQIASQTFPNWNFHIIGPIPNLPQRNNIIAYGELPFEQTIPYLKYADIGLQTLSYSPGVDSFSDSLKIIQYTYCKLPIIAPIYLKSSRDHIFYYFADSQETIKKALIEAANYNHNQIVIDNIYSWDEMIEKFIQYTKKTRDI
jgi:2-beta-glucuronyltransferase